MVDTDLLLDLVAVAGRPVPLRVLAQALDVSESDVISSAEALVDDGRLEESAGGYSAPEGTPEPSPVRAGRAARVLAGGLIDTDADPAWIGAVLVRSDTPSEAVPHLVTAADQLAESGNVTEAMVPADQALELGQELDRQTEGRLHLIRGQGRSFAGDSEGASDDFESAAARLAGEARIDALGFAATGASNLQQPQRAERLLAVAAVESVAEFPAKLGSLSALWAREVSRLGFPDEAEALLDKSDALLDRHGSAFQRYLAKWNRAWIYVDRGDYRRAEADLDSLVHTAEDGDHDSADIAEKKAYHGRALFGFGQPRQALARLEEAGAHATPSITYLIALAESEGYPRYGAWDAALAATQRLLQSVDELVPAWRNVGLFLRAKALAGSGDLDEARRTIAEALIACPPGVNGWRWRQRCRALQMDLSSRAGESFPAEEAETLIEEMLRAQWLGPAAELMVAAARYTRSPARARQAMALAWKGGDVMLAAEAADVAGAWDSELAAPVIDRVKRIESELDEAMAGSLRALPHAAAALAIERDVSDDETALRAEYEEALTAVLGDDPTLTPAQRRRARTLAKRRRRAGMYRALASVAVLSIGALSVWAAFIREPDIPDFVPGTVTVISEVPAPTVSTIPQPSEPLVGQSPARGGATRSGSLDAEPLRQVDGPYWIYPAGGPIRTTPVVFGNTVLVGSDDQLLHAINLEDGRPRWLYNAGAAVASSPVVGLASVGEGTSSNVIFFGDDDGRIHAVNALTGQPIWDELIEGRIRSSPVLTDENVVVFASESGRLHGFDPASSTELWLYPAEIEEAAAPFSSDLAYAGGLVYAVDDDGVLHVVEAESGEGVCAEGIRSGSSVVPVLGAGAVFLAKGGTIDAVPQGFCTGTPRDGLLPTYITTSVAPTPPAVSEGVMVFPVSQTLVAAALVGGADLWSEPAILDSTISAPPVIVGNIAIVGDSAGTVHARSLEDGSPVWTWDVGSAVLTEVAAIDGAILVVTNAGEVVALGAES